jgi:RNase P subunit RPR2
MTRGIHYCGATRAVHHAQTDCGSKNRFFVTPHWKKVTCGRCEKERAKGKDETFRLPNGIQFARTHCECGECFQCKTRDR